MRISLPCKFSCYKDVLVRWRECFLTQNKFRDVDEEEQNTDGILSDILDIEKENTIKKTHNFDLRVGFFRIFLTRRTNEVLQQKLSRSFMVKRMRTLNVTEMQRKQKPWIYVIPLCVHLVQVELK